MSRTESGRRLSRRRPLSLIRAGSGCGAQGTKTILAATRPASTSAIDSLTRQSGRISRVTLVLPARVELEDLAQVSAGSDDRADDGDPVQHGLEDRDGDVVVSGERDEHECCRRDEATP